jgi:hypothetical protein
VIGNVAHSQSDGKFTIAKAADGTVTRTCDNKGEGACPSSGDIVKGGSSGPPL